MAKRKRLTPATALSEPLPDDLETKSGYPFGVAPKPRAPIAQVAGEAAAQAALNELVDEMAQARRGGRLVQSLPLDAIVEDHIVRDRLVQDAAEMESLKSSLKARGQQTPVEVVELGAGRYGLISGRRRLAALRALQSEEGGVTTIEALIKPVETASDSYVAMVEENEIRANLSFYERAHLAAAATELGVYPDTGTAVAVLFANAVPAKRSKIKSFVQLHEALGAVLRFPAVIPEKLGLALVAAFRSDPALASRLRDALRKSPAADAAAERRKLERALRRGPEASPPRQEVVAGVTLEARPGRMVLTGAGVTDDLRAALELWLKSR
ncbi:MAG: ParB N-terminal domain-containing protein [Pseudomonadota bacterium]